MIQKDPVRSALKKTLKAEVQAVGALAKAIEHELPKAVALLSKRTGRIVITAVGKPSFVGMKLAASLTSLGYPATFLHPVEAVHGDLGTLAEGDVMIAISFSGNSTEVVRMVEYVARRFSIPVVAITGKRTSPLGTLADVVVPLQVAEEGSPGNIAPLASTTAAMAAGDLLVSGLAALTPISLERFAANHPGGAIGLSLIKVKERMRTGARLPHIPGTALLERALGEMTRAKWGIVGVTDAKGRLAGVITDGDVRRFVATHRSIEGRRSNEGMTKRPKTAGAEETLAEALKRMEAYQITALFVVDADKRPVGLIHIHDILT